MDPTALQAYYEAYVEEHASAHRYRDASSTDKMTSPVQLCSAERWRKINSKTMRFNPETKEWYKDVDGVHKNILTISKTATTFLAAYEKENWSLKSDRRLVIDTFTQAWEGVARADINALLDGIEKKGHYTLEIPVGYSARSFYEKYTHTEGVKTEMIFPDEPPAGRHADLQKFWHGYWTKEIEKKDGRAEFYESWDSTGRDRPVRAGEHTERVKKLALDFQFNDATKFWEKGTIARGYKPILPVQRTVEVFLYSYYNEGRQSKGFVKEFAAAYHGIRQEDVEALLLYNCRLHGRWIDLQVEALNRSGAVSGLASAPAATGLETVADDEAHQDTETIGRSDERSGSPDAAIPEFEDNSEKPDAIEDGPVARVEASKVATLPKFCISQLVDMVSEVALDDMDEFAVSLLARKPEFRDSFLKAMGQKSKARPMQDSENDSSSSPTKKTKTAE